VATYNALLKAVRNAGGAGDGGVAERCDEVLDAMSAAGVPPDVVSFNTVLRAGTSGVARDWAQGGGGGCGVSVGGWVGFRA
jgi:hypothetical protein